MHRIQVFTMIEIIPKNGVSFPNFLANFAKSFEVYSLCPSTAGAVKNQT